MRTSGEDIAPADATAGFSGEDTLGLVGNGGRSSLLAGIIGTDWLWSCCGGRVPGRDGGGRAE
jgi:hypothetical protein